MFVLIIIQWPLPNIWCQLISCDVRWSCCEANDLNRSSSILVPIFTVFFVQKPRGQECRCGDPNPGSRGQKGDLCIPSIHVSMAAIPNWPIGWTPKNSHHISATRQYVLLVWIVVTSWIPDIPDSGDDHQSYFDYLWFIITGPLKCGSQGSQMMHRLKCGSQMMVDPIWFITITGPFKWFTIIGFFNKSKKNGRRIGCTFLGKL